jgi:uncharacterized protein YheU (UPF0270 family)
MTIEFLVSLIIGVLGLIYGTIQKEKESYEKKLNDSRKALNAGDVSVVLSDQHDRVQQALRGS